MAHEKKDIRNEKRKYVYMTSEKKDIRNEKQN